MPALEVQRDDTRPDSATSRSSVGEHDTTSQPCDSPSTIIVPAANAQSIAMTELEGNISVEGEAREYPHSVSGHHKMLERNGKIWKVTRSHREERFYVSLFGANPRKVLQRSSSSANLTAIDGAEFQDAVRAIRAFVPRFYGIHTVDAWSNPRVLEQEDEEIGGLVPLASPLHKRSPRFPHDAGDHSGFPAAPPTSSHQRSASYTFGDAASGATSSSVPGHTCGLQSVASIGGATDSPPSAVKSNSSIDNSAMRRDLQGCEMIVLEDICAGFVCPCVLDVKMGSRQHGIGASDAKVSSKTKKAKGTTSFEYGFRLAGMKVWDARAASYRRLDKYQCRTLSFQQAGEVLRDFVNRSPDLSAAFSQRIGELLNAMEAQSVFRFYTSSLLLVYDSCDPITTARITMIDFAYTYTREELIAASDPDADLDVDEGYCLGLRSLQTLFNCVSN